MTEAAIETVSGRSSVRALSALAGLAPLAVSPVVNGVFAVVDQSFRISVSLGMEAAMALVNAQVIVNLVFVLLAALATGWVLYRSGSVRWGVAALGIVGLIDVCGQALNRLQASGLADGLFTGAQVTTIFFAFGAPVIVLVAVVLLGAWLCRLKGAR
ncbi:hypothetical protein [Maricaulis sp.]|uniref:hypothetical protein n=1 Tax=Maricaulis sp. TaxID=1486257 RepID=UPI003A91E5F8